jgi:epoxyqueuosine reductase
MDATRCISYLTIEHRGPIAADLMEGMGRQVFGCDICQDVCPWNSPRRLPINADPELEAREELVNPALEWLAGQAEAEFELRFNGSPVRRAGFLGLRRNVAIAMGNSGLARFAPWLEVRAGAADEGLRTAARWALGRLAGAGHLSPRKRGPGGAWSSGSSGRGDYP